MTRGSERRKACAVILPQVGSVSYFLTATGEPSLGRDGRAGRGPRPAGYRRTRLGTLPAEGQLTPREIVFYSIGSYYFDLLVNLAPVFQLYKFERCRQ